MYTVTFVFFKGHDFLGMHVQGVIKNKRPAQECWNFYANKNMLLAKYEAIKVDVYDENYEIYDSYIINNTNYKKNIKEDIDNIKNVLSRCQEAKIQELIKRTHDNNWEGYDLKNAQYDSLAIEEIKRILHT